MSDNETMTPPQTPEIERLAAAIAKVTFYHFTDYDRRQKLNQLLLEFAAEIKRSAT